MDQHWLTVIIVVLILAIVFDGIRRMRNARRDSIKMALKPSKKQNESAELEVGDNYGSEFPNGGARVSDRKIDPNRIQQVRNKYNFGTDMSAWRNKVAEKIAEHTGMAKSGQEDVNEKKAPRIEPSIDAPDPLLDDVRGVRQEAERYEKFESEEPVYDESLSDHEAEDVDTYSEQEKVIQPTSTTTKKTVSKEPPVQTSLNLEDSVPMLMESVEDENPESAMSDDDSNNGEDDDHVVEVTDDDFGNEYYDEDDAEDTMVAVKPKPIVPVANKIAPAKAEQKPMESYSANKPRYESKYADHAKHQAQVAAPQEVLVIHVKAAQNEYFYGSDLLELILDNGLRFGAMDIFHRHAGEDGEGPILFSMANMVKPGVFDLPNFEEFSTVGVSFFLGLPTETGEDMKAFDIMLATAKDIAEKLHGELKDENRSVLTKQTIEHYRERIRDFARRQKLEKSKK